MQTISKRLLLITLGSSLTLALLAAPSFGQRRNYGMRAQVNHLIHRVEQRSDVFVRLFDRALDDSRMDGTIREERLNERARELERQLDIVRVEFDRRQNHWDIRENVGQALLQAERINRVMRSRRLHPQVERQWSLLRVELNRLASVYRLRPIR